MISTIITLRRIVQQVGAATSLDEALTIIAHQIRQAIAVDACSVYLTDKDGEQYILAASDGLSPAAIAKVRAGRYGGLIGLVAERQDAGQSGAGDVSSVLR